VIFICVTFDLCDFYVVYFRYQSHQSTTGVTGLLPLWPKKLTYSYSVRVCVSERVSVCMCVTVAQKNLKLLCCNALRCVAECSGVFRCVAVCCTATHRPWPKKLMYRYSVCVCVSERVSVCMCVRACLCVSVCQYVSS